MNLVLVHGTDGRAQDWHLAGSPFRVEAEAHGWTIYDFLWSGILGGVPALDILPGDPALARFGADKGRLLPWYSAGEKLALALAHWGLIGDPELRVLTHSHGLQNWTFACCAAETLGIDVRACVAVSVSGPIRRDMQRARRYAMTRIGEWVQFADPTADDTIVQGEWFDGGGLAAQFALPEGRTVLTPGAGHHGLLYNVTLRAQYGLWETLAGTSGGDGPPAPAEDRTHL